MANINLSFGVKGGSSVATGTSGGAIRADIERICRQIETQVTKNLTFGFDKTQVRQAIKTINDEVDNISIAIPIEIPVADFRRQIDSLAQYARESFSNIKVNISTNVNPSNGGTAGAAASGTIGNTSPVRRNTTSTANALRGITERVTVNGDATRIVREYKDAASGIVTTINEIQNAEGEVVRTTTQSTASIIADINKVEQRANKAAQAIRSFNIEGKEELTGGLNDEITTLRDNISTEGISSRGAVEALSEIESKVTTAEQAVKTLSKVYAELDKVDKKFEAAKLDFNTGEANTNLFGKEIYEQAKPYIENVEKAREKLISDINAVFVKDVNSDNYSVDLTKLNVVADDMSALGEYTDNFVQKNKAIPESVREVEQALENGRRAVEEYNNSIKQYQYDNLDTYVNSVYSEEMESYFSGGIDNFEQYIRTHTTLGEISELYDTLSQKLESGTPLSTEDIDVINGRYSEMTAQISDMTEKFNVLHTTVEQGEKSYAKGIAAIERYRNTLNSFEETSVEGSGTVGLYVNEDNYNKILTLKKSVAEQVSGIETTIGRINSGEVLDASEFNHFNDSIKTLLPNLTQFISANSAMQSSISRSQQTLHGIQNTIIQNNKVYSEANYYHEKYRSSINANAEISARWNSLLNKMETGGFGNNYEAARMELAQLQADTKQAGAEVDSLSGKIKKLFGAHFGSQAAVLAIGAIVGLLPKAYQNVVAIDDAMVELKKVTDETNLSYERFRETASATAKDTGATIADTITSTADFARLGYSIDEASDLAKSALIYKNVGDGISNILEASGSIISTMKAFNIEAEDSIKIVDKFNIVGNNFAISSSGIGEALTRSAASLAAAGNTLEESIALITAANSVIQDPDSVGTAMKTLSMYLRASKTEAEAAGIETDGMAESVSKLRAEVKSLTGVDIMLDNDTYKSTMQILREIADVWDDLTDVTQANLMEKLAGKRQGNVLASILENWDVAESALDTALNSDGSAMVENEKALDSITGKVTKLQAAFEDLSSSVVNDDLVKIAIGSLTTIITFFDDMGATSTTNIALIVASFAILNNRLGIFTKYTDEFGKIHNKVINLKNLFGTGNSANTTGTGVNSYSLNLGGLTSGIEGLQWKNIFGYTKTGLKDINTRILLNKEALNSFYVEAQKHVSGGGTFVDYLNSQLNDTNSLLNKCDDSAKLFAANEDNFKALGTDVNSYSLTLDRLYATQERGKAQAQSWTATIGSFAANIGTTLLTSAASMGISMAISAGISLIANEIGKTERQIEEASAAAKELGESLDSLDDYASELEELNKTLSDGTTATSDYVSAKERLGEITDELCEKYGLERGEIDLTNASLKTQLELLQGIAKEEYNKQYRENKESYDKTVEGMEQQTLLFDDMRSGFFLDSQTFVNGVSSDDADSVKAVKEVNETLKQIYEAAGFIVTSDTSTNKRNYYGTTVTTEQVEWDVNNPTADIYTLASMLQQAFDEISKKEAEAEASGDTFAARQYKEAADYISSVIKDWVNTYLNDSTKEVLEQTIRYGAKSAELGYDDLFTRLETAGANLDEAKKSNNIEGITAAQNEFNIVYAEAMAKATADGATDFDKLAFNFFKDYFSGTIDYKSPLEEATEKFVTNMKATDSQYYTFKKAEQIQEFLNNLDYDDLQIALQIDDLFDEGLDKAAEKLENFKETNLTFEFKYADYSENVDAAIENVNKIQGVIDSINSGEAISSDTITELAAAFPAYSSQILAAADDTEQLRSVLEAIRGETVQPLIDTLTGLEGLSEDEQAAVDGLIDMLETLGSVDSTKLNEYANSLEYIQTLSERQDTANSLKNILSTSGKEISGELLSAIKTAYPALNGYIQSYLANSSAENAEALINAYLDAYSEDCKNFFDYLDDKSGGWSDSSWQKFLDENTGWADEFQKEYDINLHDFNSYLDAVEAITKKHEDDFEAYYTAMAGTGYVPTSVHELLRDRFDSENSDPIDEFNNKVNEYRIGVADEQTGDASEAFTEAMRQTEHLYNMGLISQEQYLNALEAANEKYYKDSEEHLDEYLSNQEKIYTGRQDIYKDSIDEQIEELDEQLEKGIISVAEYKTELASLRDTAYGVGSTYYGTEFATENFDEITDKLSDISTDEYEEQLDELKRVNDGALDNEEQFITDWKDLNSEMFEDLNPKKYKEVLEEIGEYELDFLKDQLDKGLISIDEYLKAVNDLFSSDEYKDKDGNSIFTADDKEEALDPDLIYDNRLDEWKKANNYDENNIASRTAYQQYRRKIVYEIYGNESSSSYNPKKLEEELTDISEEFDDLWADRIEGNKDYYQTLLDESNDYYDAEIKKLEDIADEEERINKEEELRNNLIKARQDLLDAQKNRNQLIFSGGKFTYEVDQEAVQEAQEAVEDAEDELAEQQRQTQIDLLKEQKENAENFYQEIIDKIDAYIDAISGNSPPTQVDEEVMAAVDANDTETRGIEAVDIIKMTRDGSANGVAAVIGNIDLEQLRNGSFSRDDNALLSAINRVYSDSVDITPVESASNIISQSTTEMENNSIEYDNSVTVGDINIMVQGGTSIEMLQEFSSKLGNYIQQYTTQTNYAKR